MKPPKSLIAQTINYDKIALTNAATIFMSTFILYNIVLCQERSMVFSPQNREKDISGPWPHDPVLNILVEENCGVSPALR